MERTTKNKENIIPGYGSISSMFKVKKCLFDQSFSKKGAESPTAGQQHLADSPMLISPKDEASPYALFQVKKKRSISQSKITAYIDYSSSGSIVTTPTNKKYADRDDMRDIVNCYERSPTEVKLAVQKSMLNPNLTGDFSKPCALQTIQGRHPDLQTISPSMMASVMQGTVSFNFTLIDCRYPYEFDAGHIKNAQNVFMKEDIVKFFLNDSITAEKIESKRVLIFYCEFSSERGPSMLRHLRNTDRDLNRDFYPFLYYPELYIMEGGYKAFFSEFKELCDPQEYKRMLDRDCADQLAFYKSKCKSLTRSKRLKRARSSLVL